MLVDVARNLARAVVDLHKRNIVIGDLSPRNIMARRDSRVALLDCDSYQFTSAGRLVTSAAWTPDYAAPEIISVPEKNRTTASDDFTLAILVCQLLTCGDHPFMGTPRHHDMDTMGRSENIRLGLTRLVRPGDLNFSRNAVDVSVLPPSILKLARQTFADGHLEPDVRPTAARWSGALANVRNGLRRCPDVRRHVFHSTAEVCPWCARTALGEYDPFDLGLDDDSVVPADFPLFISPPVPPVPHDRTPPPVEELVSVEEFPPMDEFPSVSVPWQPPPPSPPPARPTPARLPADPPRRYPELVPGISTGFLLLVLAALAAIIVIVFFLP
jgi:DNA-binding helix-hairpin-helix protein with protein kinase domain